MFAFTATASRICRWASRYSALTGTPAGDYWFNAKQLVTCLKALSGTVTLGIAQGGMLTLATQDAYYLQNAMRPEAQKKTQKAAQPAAAKAA